MTLCKSPNDWRPLSSYVHIHRLVTRIYFFVNFVLIKCKVYQDARGKNSNLYLIECLVRDVLPLIVMFGVIGSSGKGPGPSVGPDQHPGHRSRETCQVSAYTATSGVQKSTCTVRKLVPWITSTAVMSKNSNISERRGV